MYKRQVPCRVGLRQLARLFDDVLDGNATQETLDVIRLTAEGIYYSADCAIGYEAAKLVLKCIDGCEDDFKMCIRDRPYQIPAIFYPVVKSALFSECK